MKTFIFTYDRFDSISTSRYFKNYPHTILCHTQQQYENFMSAGHIYGDLVFTNQPKGLAYNRNYALDMMEYGEWACFWVDDLINVTYLKNYWDISEQESIGIDGRNQSRYRELFKEPCDASMFYEIANHTIQKAESKGFNLCGFALTDNPLFRDKHYSYWSLADGRCWLVRKTDLRFDVNAQLIDDTCFTALNLKKFGGVVVNNWLLPHCERYTSGAYGSIPERMEQKKRECKYLVETYPDYICYADKAGWEQFSHVKIRQKKIPAGQASLF